MEPTSDTSARGFPGVEGALSIGLVKSLLKGKWPTMIFCNLVSASIMVTLMAWLEITTRLLSKKKSKPRLFASKSAVNRLNSPGAPFAIKACLIIALISASIADICSWLGSEEISKSLSNNPSILLFCKANQFRMIKSVKG